MTLCCKRKQSLRTLALLTLALCGGRTPFAHAADKHPAPFTFVVFGDNRPDGEEKPVTEVFKRILSEVRSVHPAFVVTTGDLIFGSATDQDLVNREYDEVLPLVKSLDVPVYFAAGNHEIRGAPANEAIYRKRVSDKLYYSFDCGSAHLVVLDSDIVGQEHRITGAQFDWLQKDLQRAKGKQHRFVFLHQQPYPVSYHTGSSLDTHPDDRDRFQKLLEDNKVELLITGHEHLYDDSIHGGVREIIAGGAGAPLYPSIRGGSFFHYLIITIDGPKTYVSVVKPGSLFASDEILEKAPSEKVDPFAKPEH
ncbi:MAG: metallophosphoesterase [Armatimonadota bacterium]|nr:metallophosphoesterase [Armatimonadota bacterium]